MAPPEKKPPRGDETDRVDVGTLEKLRDESRLGPLPGPDPAEPEEFLATTNRVDRDMMERLRVHSRRTGEQPPATDSEPTEPRGAPPQARPFDQPVIESLEEWTAAASGEFSVDLDLDDLAELTPLTPPQQSVLRFPTVSRAGPSLRAMAIDFGTSYSAVALLGDEGPVLLPPPAGCIPSAVGVREDGFTVVGEEARAMRVTDPSNMISSPKRLLGRAYRDRELEPYLADMGMLASEGQAGEIMLRAHRQLYSVEQLCATVIYRLRMYAKEHAGVDVTDAVFTIPVSFGPERVRALTRAAAIGGVSVIKVIEEPAAAALAYRGDPNFRGLVAVYDFGGGTFDFSVVDVAGGLTVVATAGDTWLGGDDMDEALAGAVADAFWRQKRIELRYQAVEWQRLLFASEQAKRALSVSHEATIELDSVARTAEGVLNLSVTVTRPLLAELVKDLVDRSLETCQQALELSGIAPDQLNAVYMSGGTSFVPAVLDGVASFFGKIPLISVPPDKAVILGAAGYVRLLQELRAGA